MGRVANALLNSAPDDDDPPPPPAVTEDEAEVEIPDRCRVKGVTNNVESVAPSRAITEEDTKQYNTKEELMSAD